MRDSRTARRGHTLVELLVVLVLMAILTAVAAPTIAGRPHPEAPVDAVRTLRLRAARLRQPVESTTVGANGRVTHYVHPSGWVLTDSGGVVAWQAGGAAHATP